jgi:hypothetical protein
VDALYEAEGRGVDVRVLTNGPHTDQQVVRQAGRRCYEQLLGCGGRIFEYQRTMLHAKVLVVDSQWVTVGSRRGGLAGLVVSPSALSSRWNKWPGTFGERPIGSE